MCKTICINQSDTFYNGKNLPLVLKCDPNFNMSQPIFRPLIKKKVFGLILKGLL